MSNWRLPFSEHIEELRKRLRVVAISFLVIFLVVLVFPTNPASSVQNPGQYLNLSFLRYTVIASFLQSSVGYILAGTNITLVAASGIGEGMEVYFVAAIILTLALDMPVIAYETYRFIDPALSEKEKKLVYPFVTSASILFLAGILFGYFVLAKFLVVALLPFLAATKISTYVDAASFYYVLFLIIGSTGVSFTSPVFVYSLIRLRVIEADFFSKNRIVIWFLIWVVAGLFLTPDGGPLLDLVVFVPIVAMVEIAVALGRRSVRGEPPKARKGGIVCPHCGTALPRPMLFCDNCGKSIA